MRDRRSYILMTPHDPEEFASTLDGSTSSLAIQVPQSRKGRIARVITGFLLGQGASQAIGILGSILLVRLLSVEAYAQFGVATGYQTVFSILMDSGLSGTIIPLVGERIHDRKVIGRYVRAAYYLRNRLFWTLTPFAAVAFFGTVHKHHWPLGIRTALLVSILVSLYSGGKVAFYAAPLLLGRNLRAYYLPQILSNGARLVAYVCLFYGGGLTSWTAAGLGALTLTLNGRLIQKASRQCFEWPDKEDADTNKELVRYVLPAMPAILFSAFQSQLTLLLVSIFGNSLYIAEMTALSRIATLFTVLMTFNSMVIEPFIARIDRDRLLRHFVGFVTIAAVACSPLVFIAFRWPGAYLFILGAKYESLRYVIGWYVLAGYINFISGLIWVMNRARKWVFWSGSIFEVALLLIVQITYIIVVGVRTTEEAVRLTLVCSGCYLVAHGYVTIRGFVEDFGPSVPANAA